MLVYLARNLVKILSIGEDIWGLSEGHIATPEEVREILEQNTDRGRLHCLLFTMVESLINIVDEDETEGKVADVLGLRIQANEGPCIFHQASAGKLSCCGGLAVTGRMQIGRLIFESRTDGHESAPDYNEACCMS